MKWLLLSLFTLSAHAAAPAFVSQQPVELVFVDTGIPAEFSDYLYVAPTCKVRCHYSHGLDMVTAANDELRRRKAKPVHAAMVYWNYQEFSVYNGFTHELSTAIDYNPKVISLSIDGRSPSATEEKLIKYATSHGILVVAAAGNRDKEKGIREPMFQSYPASYDTPCLLKVGNYRDHQLTDYTNLGEIYMEENPKDPPGTSASTARAAAVAIHYMQEHPGSSCKDVEKWMISRLGSIR